MVNIFYVEGNSECERKYTLYIIQNRQKIIIPKYAKTFIRTVKKVYHVNIFIGCRDNVIISMFVKKIDNFALYLNVKPFWQLLKKNTFHVIEKCKVIMKSCEQNVIILKCGTVTLTLSHDLFQIQG